MYWKLIKNDISASKLITATTTMFIVIAAVLVALAAILSVNLASSIDTLMETAKAPHYMQMHAGTVNQSRLADFVKNNSNVASYEVSEFLNLRGSDIQIEDHSFADSVEDNGIAVQNQNLDYFLDMENQRIQPKPGELYVPVIFKKQGIAKIGDTVKLAGRQFQITGFLRDGTMNSQMAGSKRFLVHPQQYQELFSKGSLEYIIQFRLKDPSKLNQFEAAYKKAGLEVNGPAVSYRLIKLGNAMSDGIMIAVLLLISLLVVLMAFMCIRFTLLAKIEEDYHEIGVMKAIGLQIKEIKKIYLAKYLAIAVFGSLLGYLISLPLSYQLLKNIKLFMGASRNEGLSWYVAIIGVFVVTCLMIAYVYRLLNRFKKISAVEAIRFNGTKEKVNTKTRLNLRKLKFLSPNARMGILDLINRKKMYFTLLLVVMLSSFIMIVPALVYQTVDSDKFVEGIGISNKVDLLTSLYESTNNNEYEQKMQDYLDQDDEIVTYNTITTKNFEVKETGSTDNVLSVELGDHQKFPVSYTAGRQPEKANELALSTINAEEYQKKIGDSMILLLAGKEEKFIVTGIYANVFNGGKTAKATFEDQKTPKIWTSFYIDVKDSTDLEKKMAQYKRELPYAKINNTREYRDQTLGSMIASLKLIAFGSIMIALVVTGLITALFIKLLLVKDRREIATLKALGFNDKAIANQYLARSLTVLLIGVSLGTILSMTLGKVLAAGITSALGGVQVALSGSWLVYWGCPLLMLAVTIATTKLVTSQTARIEISQNLKD